MCADTALGKEMMSRKVAQLGQMTAWEHSTAGMEGWELAGLWMLRNERLTSSRRCGKELFQNSLGERVEVGVWTVEANAPSSAQGSAQSD